MSIISTDLTPFQIDDTLKAALREDVHSEDYSTNAIFDHHGQAKVSLFAKEAGVLAGLTVFQRVFTLFDAEVTFQNPHQFKDGDRLTSGDLVLEIIGSGGSLLTCERVALNFLQHLSGIASMTAAYVEALGDDCIKVFDTRKTTPNLRLFEKYAVRVGGGYNHRFNLSDAILLKDNHIAAVGSVQKAIAQARAYAPFVKMVEVEVESLAAAEEAAAAGADIIMLDNMSLEQIEQAITLIAGRSRIECSGNIDMTTISRFRGLAIDYVSSGSLTHSAKSLDFSMKGLTYLDV
ncbi:nicotinate-nucleotide pyrophosphorylase [Streptococcus pneumoniae]|nr:nicotinate-nucleotide pyrophosphorylase [Streptococcus pneumoniae]CAG6178162.1 nicotinate-nucleotide pyrophosphorylase [Streptococcus pneumoniae]CAG6281114.1 nicotinate-nucleotide pyrophosphorylase [Streptococcus pneumoniae]